VVTERRESIAVRPASAVILAGGRSARMGQPKATLILGGVTLIERTVAELARAFVDIVVVAAPAEEAIELPALGAVTIVRDDDAYQGPVGALARGLRAADIVNRRARRRGDSPGWRTITAAARALSPAMRRQA
jgi:molybdopterin-guanine dinucleotide biosynthesis protein A